jgi:hypothetical protein
LKKADEIKVLVDRANEHLTRIRQMLITPLSPNIPTTYTGIDLRRKFFEDCLDQVVLHIRVRIGEFANSLRSPLNYVACAFAEQDSGTVGKLVQFPIEDDPKSFRDRRTTYLKGVNDPHVTLIEGCQPYSGRNCMKFLRDFSHFYKHRGLVVVHRQAHYIEVISPQSDGESRNPHFAITFDTWRDKSGTEYIQPRIPVEVTLPDATPIMHVLDDIQRSVTVMLSDFEPLLN